MKRMKKLIALLLTLVLCVSLMAACGGKTEPTVSTPSTSASTPASTPNAPALPDNPDDAAQSGVVEAVNLANDRDPTDLGPWAGNMGGASAIIPLVYQTLFIRELGGESEPCLGKTLTKVDEKTYDVEIFDYIYDSEGNHMTADDVVFSFNCAKENGKVNAIKVVDSVEKTGDFSVRVNFSDRARMGDFEGFFNQFFVITQAAYESSPDKMVTSPVGTAAYKLDKYTSGSLISFVARDDYWQTDAQYIARSSQVHAKTINYYIVTEAAQRATGIQEGTLDYAGISYTDLERIKALDNYYITEVPDNLTWMLMPNVADAASTKDLNVRLAVFYAIDNEGVAAAFSSGYAVPVYDMSNSNYPDYYAEAYKAKAADTYYGYDPAKAAEYLAAAGYKEGELTLRLICSSDQASIEVATIIEAYLNAVGINLEISSYQGNMMSTYAEDQTAWDLYLLQYASTDYAVNVWEKLLNKAKYKWEGTINFIMSDELQQKLSDVRSTSGHTEENVIAFHDYIVENAYGLGIMQGINYFGTSKKIESVVFSDQRIIRPNASIYAAD